MSIDVPAAGDPILDTWGDDVATRLNQLVPYMRTSDLVFDTGQPTGEGVFAMPVVNGRSYRGIIFGMYEVSATNKGLQLRIAEDATAAGTVRGFQRITGNGSDTGYYLSRVTENWAGSTSTDAASLHRAFWLDFVYQCTADGNLQFRVARGGTSGGTGVTVFAGTGCLLFESEV